MVEDWTQSYITVAPVVVKHFLVPRYLIEENEMNPMNIIYPSLNLYVPLDNSEKRWCGAGLHVYVPKICLSLAKDEFPGQYSSPIISREFYGYQTLMTEVFLVMIFRANDEDYKEAVLDLLKSGSHRVGAVLITSVLIRHEVESVATCSRE